MTKIDTRENGVEDEAFYRGRKRRRDIQNGELSRFRREKCFKKVFLAVCITFDYVCRGRFKL
jgi:hypothetical protein